MAKRSSLTKILAEAAFYQAWFANIQEIKQDPETYQRTFQRCLKRLEKLPALALKNVANIKALKTGRVPIGLSKNEKRNGKINPIRNYPGI
jgi:hypothetical protein